MLEILRGRAPALRSRNFRLLWAGQAISVAGGQMQSVALNWHLYELTGSPVALGAIGLVRVVPIVVFSLLGGAVADAHDRRRVLLLTQTVMASIAATLGLLTQLGRITPAHIYALTALSAATIAFNNPARQAFTPSLVPREHFANALSLAQITHQIANILGPMAAGALLAHSQLAACYWANAASFGGVILALLLIRPPQITSPPAPPSTISWSAVLEGLAFVRSNPILVWTILLDFLATFFSSASALLPIFAKDVLHAGPRGYGILSAAPAAGSLLAGAFLALTPTIRRQGVLILWAVTAYGAATVIFGASTIFWLSWLALAATGAADTVSTILRGTIRQLVTPEHLRGRMTAASMIFFMGGPQLGELEAGLVAAWIGAPWSVITGGVGCLLAVAWVAARAPQLRRYHGE